MNLRPALAATCTLLLLGSSGVTALARTPTTVSHTSSTTSSTPLAVVRSYFAALNRPDLEEHKYYMLERWYAPSISVLESLTTGRPRLHSGLRAVHAFDRQNRFSWSLQRFEQFSPSVVLTIEEPYVKGPGHELENARPWLTIFTIKNGRISTLVWLPCGRNQGAVAKFDPRGNYLGITQSPYSAIEGMALDLHGNVYEAATAARNQPGMPKFSPSLKHITNLPVNTNSADLVVDRAGDMYITDDVGNRIVKTDPTGKWLAVWN
jgi:hypothetical protein